MILEDTIKPQEKRSDYIARKFEERMKENNITFEGMNLVSSGYISLFGLTGPVDTEKMDILIYIYQTRYKKGREDQYNDSMKDRYGVKH